MKNIFKSDKFKSLYKGIFRPIIVLTAICFVISVCLSLTNLLTKDKIAKREIAAQQEAMASLIPNAEYKQVDLGGSKTYITGEGFSFYVALKDGQTAGYIVTCCAKGYGGDVKVMTAVSADKTVIGVDILSVADETPGLGQNAAKPDFYEQLSGKGENIVLVKNSAKSDKNEIDAVTGATITSKAAVKAVNEAIEAVKAYEAEYAQEVSEADEK